MVQLHTLYEGAHISDLSTVAIIDKLLILYAGTLIITVVAVVGLGFVGNTSIAALGGALL